MRFSSPTGSWATSLTNHPIALVRRHVARFRASLDGLDSPGDLAVTGLDEDPSRRGHVEPIGVRASAVEAKRQFFDQLGELLRNPRIWALFALREDYLAPLEGGGIELAGGERGEEVAVPYARRVPTHFKNRFRIDLLGLGAAREAMVEPARVGGREFPAVDRLLQDLVR